MGLKESGLRGSLRNVSVATFSVPDTVTSRPNDDSTDSSGTITSKRGVEIDPNGDFRAVGARISQNTSGVSRAYLRRVSDLTTLDETDLSGVSTGDAFRLDADINQGTKYEIVVDAEGSSYTLGFASNTSGTTYTGEDIDITDGRAGGSSNNTQAVNDVGDPDNIL